MNEDKTNVVEISSQYQRAGVLLTNEQFDEILKILDTMEADFEDLLEDSDDIK